MTLATVESQTIAAVRERVSITNLGEKMRPALDQVWAFIRAAGLTSGHNVMLYLDENNEGLLFKPEGVPIEFGVQVSEPFEDAPPVVCSALPSGRVATAVHIGPYDRLGDAHAAVRAWCAQEGLVITGVNWEVYGDWDDDPARLRTEVFYLID